LDFEKNDPYTDVFYRDSENRNPLIRKFTIKKVDDCAKNKSSYDPVTKMVIISYCNYDGEKFVEDLDEKGDDMWMELKMEGEEKTQRRRF
jgi:hypothetical protein